MKGLPQQKETQCKFKIPGGIFLSLMRQGAVAEGKIGIDLVVEKPFWRGSATPPCAPWSFLSSLAAAAGISLTLPQTATPFEAQLYLLIFIFLKFSKCFF